MTENEYQNQSRSSRRIAPALVAFAVGLSAASPAWGAAPDEAMRSRAQQLVSLLDYVAADYPRAVTDDGQVLVASEFDEQKGLLRDAEEIAAELPPGNADVKSAIVGIEHLAAATAPGTKLAAQLAQVHELVMKRFEIASAPTQLPNLEHGAQLYGVACAACHGADGRSQTEAAAQLDPKPAMFTDVERMSKLSPFRAYNTVTFGAQGTSMAAFDTLSDADRWDLATYVFTLRQPQKDLAPGRQAASRAGLSLGSSQLATLTDGELLARLSKAGVTGTDSEAALAFLRGTSAYRPSANTDLSGIRRSFELATSRYTSGQKVDGRASLLTAYLEGFEPKEPALRARDADLVSEVEDAFVRLRGSMESDGAASDVDAQAARLDALLERIEGAGSGRAESQVAFWGALLIVLREGLEAALLVSALLAVLKRAGRAGQANAVHLGWVSALLLGVVAWFASGKLLASIGGRREVIEGVVQLFTAALLFYASHWLLAQAHGQRWLTFLKQQAPGRTGGLSVAGLAFLAVFRELLEVVVFFRGLQVETGDSAVWLWGGAVAGGVVLAIAVLGFLRLGKRLPIRPFLLGCGLMMCTLSVVMVGHGVRALQEAGWLRLTPLAFHSIDVIGLYNSVQGLLAQGGLVLALLGSAAWVLLRSREEGPSVPGPQAPRPAAG